ncbi:acyltransferase family protein [Arthrobacter sp. NPDC058097]|uniref:acyltransferase family protein n=1 Tax=Arthrobacter sp. NPDC058097 TaxID=3346340 RepID=UPI0036DBDCB0
MTEAAWPDGRLQLQRGGNIMTTPSSVRVRSGRVQGLDLIRGFAILLVLLRHAWPEIFGSAGVVGVVIFFALSGFLITGLLERDIREFGRVRYSRFYLHRFFRLMPALTFMLLGFALIEGQWNLLGDRHLVGLSVVVGLTYTMNVPGIDHGSDALSHLWTLATEEQFYLLWPIVLAFGMRRAKAGTVTALAVLAALALCAASVVVVSPETFKIYSLPTSWVAAMLLGALAKLHENALDRSVVGLRSKTIACVGLVALLGLSFTPEAKNWPGTYLLVGPFIALCTIAVIFECKRWRNLPSKYLRPILGLGVISYAAYLWNYPIAIWLGDRPLNLFQGSASIALTILAATLSWYVIELPASKVKRRLENRLGAKRRSPSHRLTVN